MMTRSGLLGAILVAVLFLSAVPATLAQEEPQDPRVVKLIATMQEQIEKAKTSYTEMTIKMNAPGVALPPFIADGMLVYQWRDGDNMRLEIPNMNMVMLLEEKAMTMYMGMVGMALVIPPDGMEKLMETGAEALQQLGIENMMDQDRMFLAMLGGTVTIAGEETVDGVDCYVLEIAVEAMDALVNANPMMGMGGVGGAEGVDVELNNISMVVEKETATPKLMAMEMAISQPNGVAMNVAMDMSFDVVDYDADIPEALFDFELPEDTTIVEWTADKTAEELIAEFQAAVMQGVQGMVEGQQQG